MASDLQRAIEDVQFFAEKRYCDFVYDGECSGAIRNVCIDDNYETSLCTKHIALVRTETYVEVLAD